MARKAADGESQSMMGYFRKIFEENQEWLKTRSNDEVVKRYLADHPGETELNERARNALTNVKSHLRHKLRVGPAKRRKRAAVTATPQAPAAKAQPRVRVRGLDELEVRIDDCLMAARALDREGLDEVIKTLRRARNEVVWMSGQ